MPVEPSHTSIRMRICPDRTLNGYVFTDEAHAKEWLRSLDPAGRKQVRLDWVEVGPSTKCHCCGGTGHRQRVTKLEDITLSELLGEET